MVAVCAEPFDSRSYALAPLGAGRCRCGLEFSCATLWFATTPKGFRLSSQCAHSCCELSATRSSSTGHRKGRCAGQCRTAPSSCAACRPNCHTQAKPNTRIQSIHCLASECTWQPPTFSVIVAARCCDAQHCGVTLCCMTCAVLSAATPATLSDPLMRRSRIAVLSGPSATGKCSARHPLQVLGTHRRAATGAEMPIRRAVDGSAGSSNANGSAATFFVFGFGSRHSARQRARTSRSRQQRTRSDESVLHVERCALSATRQVSATCCSCMLNVVCYLLRVVCCLLRCMRQRT